MTSGDRPRISVSKAPVYRTPKACLVEGLSVGDLEGRKAMFWAVLKDVPEGPSKRSRVRELLKGGS